MNTITVWVTPWGEHVESAIPEALRNRLVTTRKTKSGLPDKRYKSGKTLWKELCNWSWSLYNGQA
jgi:hypothetical protein